MSSVNGVLSPSMLSDSTNVPINLSAKRKRDDTTLLHDHTNGDTKGVESNGGLNEDQRIMIHDLIDILQSHDISPSILTRALPDHDSLTEPLAKRQKADQGNESSSSIMARVSSNAYRTVEEVLNDIDNAASDIKEKLQLPDGPTRNQYIPAPAEQSELSMKVSAFKQKAHDLVRREKALKEAQSNTSPSITTNAANYASGGSLGSNSAAQSQISAAPVDRKRVLTLYGNAPGPKQLFSSLQIPTKVIGESRGIAQPLREAGLPNGITTTQIYPIQATGFVDDRKRTPTLGEVFPTPASVPPLQPPKPSKISTTRSSTVGWYQPTSVDTASRSASYFKQPISTGQWLDYSNASPPQGIKRKQRDRAISFSSTKAPHSDAETIEADTTKLDGLFRSAYSGFAPTKDDAAAVAPEGVMNRIWWQQVGEKSFEHHVENVNNRGGIQTTDRCQDGSVAIDDVCQVEAFQEAVEKFEEESIDPSLVPLEGSEKSAEEKDIEEILDGISELLETLNSYQRIRHMSLNPSSRPAGLLSAPDTTSIGTPSKPSEPEQATYEILRSQLSLMIASLPPYAVAKLDSNRLADLSISTKIEIRMEDYKGVMEEDETAARAKAAALNAVSSSRAPQASSLHRNSSSSLYGNQYAAPRPGSSTSHQYYGSAQTPIRPPSINMQRPQTTGPGPYQHQRPASGAPYRPAAYGTPTYPHQTPRPAQQPYAQSNSTQYLHTPGSQNYMRSPGQTYQNAGQSAAQPSVSTRYPSQSSYSHQTPSQNGSDYRYGNNTNIVRQASPQKPLLSPQQASASYSTPTTSTQDRRTFSQSSVIQNSMLNGGSSRSPQSQYAPTGPTNYSTFMTTEQQASMMERQRAQLAQQQGTQQQARNAAQAGTMGSPSKGQVNGNPVAAGL